MSLFTRRRKKGEMTLRSVFTMSVFTESDSELLKSNHFRNSAAELNTSGSRKCISDHSSFRLF